MKGSKVELKSRNDKSFNEKFYPVYDALKDMDLDAIIDGEVVVLSKNGTANFGSLQNWRSEADGDLVYYIFDILWYKEKDLTELTLCERKAILKEILPKSDNILVSEHFETSGIAFLEEAKKLGLEGIMAKRKDSIYHIHNRSRDWLKIKANKRQEVVIGGFTLNDDSNKLFSSILVGVYEGKKLVYTGKVGTGFNEKMQKEMMAQFKPLITKKVPFAEEPDVNKPSRFRPNPPHATVTWLKPELVCEVSFTEMTSDGVMRHPSFDGMREDKSAKKVVLENEEPIEISDIEKIRIKAKSESEKIVQEKLGFIVQYTKEKFAPYSSDEEINRFRIYLIEFLKGSKIDTITPIRVNTLKTIDLMHFGWNVWHHYRGNNQRKDVAKFLKIVFSESFKEMEESTIEKLLSSRKEEGLIKIEDNLL